MPFPGAAYHVCMARLLAALGSRQLSFLHVNHEKSMHAHAYSCITSQLACSPTHLTGNNSIKFEISLRSKSQNSSKVTKPRW